MQVSPRARPDRDRRDGRADRFRCGAAANYASELAINEVTLRAYSELQHFYVELATEALLVELLRTGDAQRPRLPPVAGRRGDPFLAELIFRP